MPKKETVSELKKQLTNLQEKISSIEEKQNSVSEQDRHNVHSSENKQEHFKVETLYKWTSPERLYIPRNRKWFVYLFLLVLLIIIVLLFIQEFIIIAPIAAIGFIAYVLATVPPHDIEHLLTTEGINSSGHSYLWQEMYDFWIVKKGNEKIIHIDTNLNYPRRIIILVGQGDLEQIKQIMVQFIPFREIPKENFLDKILDYLSEKFHKFAS